MAANSVFAFLDTLEFVEVEAWADAGAERCVELWLEIMPSTDHPENIYATNRLRDSVKVERLSWDRRRIYSDLRHAGYADEGYTRQRGKATARPYGERGGVDYTAQIANQLGIEMSEDLIKRMNNARG